MLLKRCCIRLCLAYKAMSAGLNWNLCGERSMFTSSRLIFWFQPAVTPSSTSLRKDRFDHLPPSGAVAGDTFSVSALVHQKRA